MIIPQHTTLGRNSSPGQLGDLVFGDQYSFPSTETNFMLSGRNFWTPQLLNNGFENYLIASRANAGSEKLCLLAHDSRYGLFPPFAVANRLPGGADDGNHHVPTILKEGGKLYALREIEHNADPVGIHKTINQNDFVLWQAGSNTIASTPTYPNLYQLNNGVKIMVSQINDLNAGLNYNINGTIDSAWSAQNTIVAAVGANAFYVTGVINSHLRQDYAIVLINHRVAASSIYFQRCVVKIHVSLAGVITYRNWDDTFSKNSGLTNAELLANFKYFDTGSDAIDSEEPICAALSINGKFYDVARDGSGNNQFVILAVGQSPAAATLKAFPSAGDVRCVLPLRTSLIYAFAVESGDIIRYVTTDEGNNWTSLGDVFPGVGSLGYFTVPYNAAAIGNNQNFFVIAPAGGAIHVRKAAFGSLESEAPANFYINTPSMSEAEYDAMMDFSYKIEAGKISNTGTTLTALTDQSPNARNIIGAAIGGSPVIDNATTPTQVVMDGVNDFCQIGITGYTGKTNGVIIVVGNPAFYWLTASRNVGTATYMRWTVTGGFTEYFGSFNTASSQIKGTTAVPAGKAIFMFQHMGIGDVMQWYNGQMQRRNVVVQHDVSEGQFIAGLPSGATHFEIGRLVRSSISYTGSTWSHIAMAPAQTLSNLAKMHKFLSQKYSIQLVSPFF
jgi:hypothetical protein